MFNTAAWDIQDHQASKDVPGGQGVVEGNVIPYHRGRREEAGELSEPRNGRPGNEVLSAGRPPESPTCRIRFRSPEADQADDALSVRACHAQIYMDGRRIPRVTIDWWMGDSRGRWEGDTLVVDVVDFNEDTWFDRAGNFHSDELHLVERYTRTEPRPHPYDVTVEDPKVFTGRGR